MLAWASLPSPKEVEHPPREQRGGAGIVRRQAGVGEQMLIARVEEQLGMRDGRDEGTGGVDIALAGEERIRVHAVNLHGQFRRPRRAELRDGDAGVEQQRAARARSGLGQALGRQHPERESGIDEPAGEIIGGPHPARDDLAKTDLIGVGHTVVEIVVDTAVVEVRRVDGMPGAGQPLSANAPLRSPG